MKHLYKLKIRRPVTLVPCSYQRRFSKIIMCLCISILFLLNSCREQNSEPSRNSITEYHSAFDEVLRTRSLRVGYGGFKPYTIINFNAEHEEDRVTGFCADIVKEIAGRQSPPWKIEWHKISWETLSAEMQSGKFDFIADPVYISIPRASLFLFTNPFSYFGVAVGLIRKGDRRFTNFADLNNQSVTIVLAEGWTSTEYARKNLFNARLQVIPIGEDPFIQFQEVLTGRADIALQDVPSVLQYVEAHPGQAEAKWINSPPSRMPGAFMMRKEDRELKEFLDSSFEVLNADGTIATFEKKWKTYGEFKREEYYPGTGLLGNK